MDFDFRLQEVYNKGNILKIDRLMYLGSMNLKILLLTKLQWQSASGFLVHFYHTTISTKKFGGGCGRE
jgi:hypothetical protein